MTRDSLIEEALTHTVIGAFYEVYNILGFGFLEGLYVRALEHELIKRGMLVRREVPVRVAYKDLELGKHSLDMVVEGKLIIEAKSTYRLADHASRQLYNYLRAANLDVGLLLHFGPKPQFFRMINRPSAENRIGRIERSDPFYPSNLKHP